MVGGVAKQRERKGNFYVESRLKLEAEVNELLQNLQQLEEEKQRTAAKEQVLVNLVAQQDCMLEKLKQLRLAGHPQHAPAPPPPPAAAGGGGDSGSQQATSSSSNRAPQQGFASNTLTGTYQSPFMLRQDQLQLLVDSNCGVGSDIQQATPGRPSPFQVDTGFGQVVAGFTVQGQQGYLFRLLESATKELWERAVNMTAMDWCQLYSSTVAHLMQYNAVIMPPPEEQQQQQQQQQSSRQGAAAAAAVGQVPTEVQQIVDNFFSHVVVILATNNTMPYRLAAHVDLSTGTPIDNVPDSHWQQVLAALQLTPPQVLQLKAAWEQFKRAKLKLKQHQAEVGRKMGAATDRKAVRWGKDGACAAEVHKTRLASMLDMNSQDDLAAILGLDSEDGTTGSEQQSPPAAAAAGAGSSSSQTEDSASDPRFLTPDWAGAEVIAQEELGRILTATNVAAMMQSCYMMNHLNSRQLACLLVKCYPVLPRTAAILEALYESDDAVKG